MTKYDFIDDLIILFKKLDGKSDEIKRRNLDRFVEYFLLTLTDVGVSEEVCKHSDDKWIKDSGGDYFCLVCEGEIEA